jgi:hypothetical protein
MLELMAGVSPPPLRMASVFPLKILFSLIFLRV